MDTYGLLHKKDLRRYFQSLESRLDLDIIIGYHAHNNFQLGYSNAMEFVNSRSKHRKVVDATLYGMGKSAGNDPIELVAMFLNEEHGKRYNLDSIMEAIDNNIMEIYRKTYWGYSFLYYLAALNDCHPNYVKNLLEKGTLSV